MAYLTPGSFPSRRPLWAVAGIFAAAVLLSSCTEDTAEQAAGGPETAAAETPPPLPDPDAPNILPPVGEMTGAEPTAPAGGGAAAVPAGAGIMPAEGVQSDPALAAEAETPGVATARWGNRGPEVGGDRRSWRSIGGDGIHGRDTEAVSMLQQPRSALRSLPPSISGNYVDWVAALRNGAIRPRARVWSQGQMEVLDQDILLADTKGMPIVTFPHRAHTEWLSCGNCHDWLFKKQAGSTDIKMADIARGRSCGLCHGKVAFPATECFRCHNGPRPK